MKSDFFATGPAGPRRVDLAAGSPCSRSRSSTRSTRSEARSFWATRPSRFRVSVERDGVEVEVPADPRSGAARRGAPVGARNGDLALRGAFRPLTRLQGPSRTGAGTQERKEGRKVRIVGTIDLPNHLLPTDQTPNRPPSQPTSTLMWHRSAQRRASAITAPPVFPPLRGERTPEGRNRSVG